MSQCPTEPLVVMRQTSDNLWFPKLGQPRSVERGTPAPSESPPKPPMPTVCRLVPRPPETIKSVEMAVVKTDPETDADIVAQAVDKFLSNPRVQHTKLVDMSTNAKLTIC